MLKPDRANGRPGIYGGFSPNGDRVLIKVWPRASSGNDRDLEEIWRHELRQLHRLAGYPGAADCIAHLSEAGYDAQGFYLVLGPGQRQPLNRVLDTVGPGHWLRQTKQPASRARVWRNLRLLARGLETLHSQGLLHRNLDSWAVLTAGGDEPDFQLTGFEWSMRIVGAEIARRGSALRGTSHTTDSFLRDWLMFGLLAADLLGVKSNRLLDRSLVPYEVADHLNVEEARLLRNITQVHPIFPLNGDVVAARIDEILRSP